MPIATEIEALNAYSAMDVDFISFEGAPFGIEAASNDLELLESKFLETLHVATE